MSQSLKYYIIDRGTGAVLKPMASAEACRKYVKRHNDPTAHPDEQISWCASIN